MVKSYCGKANFLFFYVDFLITDGMCDLLFQTEQRIEIIAFNIFVEALPSEQ